MSPRLLLTVDVGNTQTALGVFDQAELIDHWRVHTQHELTADECLAIITGLFGASGRRLSEITALAIASVVPPLTASFASLKLPAAEVDPLVVTGETKLGITVRIDDPREVGPDRLVNALAAHELTRRDCIVVDFGTAITLDAVSAAGEYLGGAIAPGIEVSTGALYAAAARLFEVDLHAPKRAVGANTADSLRAGIVLGFAGLVDGLVQRIAAELAWEPEVIATGGHAEAILDFCTGISRHEPMLTLQGLRLAWERCRSA